MLMKDNGYSAYVKFPFIRGISSSERRVWWKLAFIVNSDLFDWLNNYHPNIKFLIELNPSKFLDTKLTNICVVYKFNVY